ncbi:MAG: hypothetical protein LLF96_03075 [Eubacteriales bacterium]|nr:hypothetical protein [Eubacteriales bacterium]
MKSNDRLTRKKLHEGYLPGRGRLATEYTADVSKQEITIRLAAYEDTGLTPEEVEALKGKALADVVEAQEGGGGLGPLSVQDADALEAYRTGRMICPQSCATCFHYPDASQPIALCPKTGRMTRKLQYCSEWEIGLDRGGGAE